MNGCLWPEISTATPIMDCKFEENKTDKDWLAAFHS